MNIKSVLSLIIVGVIVMNNRTVIKQDLRTIAEIGIVGVLGKIPRRLRRSAGRQFASSAYRKLNGLPTLNFKTNPAVIDWIVREYKEYQLSKTSNQADRTDAANNGDTTPAVADQRNDGAGVEEPLDDSKPNEVVGG